MSGHGEDIHGQATRPAGEIDPEPAFAALNGRRRACAEDPVHLEKAALDYASATMLGALGEIALRADALDRDGALGGEAGWAVFSMPQRRRHDSVALMLVHGVRRGGYLLTVGFAPPLTAEAAARAAELGARIRARRTSAGMSDREQVLAEIRAALDPRAGKRDADPEQAEVSALLAAPSSYAPLTADTPVRGLTAVAVGFGSGPWRGRGRGGAPLEMDDEWQPADKALASSPDDIGRGPGLVADLRPPLTYGEGTETFNARSTRQGVMPGPLMMALSELIRSQGLAHRVERDNRRARSLPWWTSGVADYPRFEEAGRAAVCAAGGFYDASVHARLAAFSAQTAAAQVSENLEDWVRTARRMIEMGFTSPDTAFDANDMRDIAHAARSEDPRTGAEVLSLINRTQHGVFRLDMRMGALGVEAVTASRMPGPVVGRFVAGPGGMRPDYEAEPRVPYALRAVRDMNGIINSLSSVACVFDEEAPRLPEFS